MAKIFNPAKIAYFKSILSYDENTGAFTWLEDRGGHAGRAGCGATAGTMQDGYILIGIDGTVYRAHILAWWFMTGTSVPPGKELDHRDRNRSNNRWLNLCLKNRSRNNHNANPSKRNKSGVRGISWSNQANKWDARIRVNNKIICLGTYSEFAEAVSVRIKAEKQYLGESPTEQTGVTPSAARYIPEVLPKRVPTAEEIETGIRNRSLTVRTTNTSGCPGVRLHKLSGLWHARIVINYKETSLGYFKTKEEAIIARKAAEAQRFAAT